MSEVRKRKRQSFSTPETPPAATDISLQSNQPRRSLQRSSKDRVYAQRLEAKDDTVATFNGSSGSNNKSDRSNHDSRKSAISKSNKNRRLSRSTGKKREEVPSGWPFIDSRDKPTAKQTTDVKKSVLRGTDCGNDLPVLTRRQQRELASGMPVDRALLNIDECANLNIASSGGSCNNNSSSFESKPSIQTPINAKKSRTRRKCSIGISERCKQFEVHGNVPGNSNGDGISNIASGDGSDKPDGKARESQDTSNSMKSQPLQEPTTPSNNSTPTNNDSNESAGDASRSSKECKKSQKTIAESTTPRPPASTTAKIWTCSRCTLTNSNRRKKCEACGNIKHLSMTSDGTFALSEGVSKQSSSGGYKKSSHDDETVSSQVVSLSNQQWTVTSANMSDVSCVPAYNDLFVIASEPVSTRSRFKRARLSQGMMQIEDETQKSQQSSFEASSKDEASSSSENDSSSNHKQPVDAKSYKSFVSMLKESKSGRRERRMKEKAKRVERYLQKTGKVKVAVRLSLHDDKSTEELNDGNLVAYIPSELMCRMKFGSHDSAEESNRNDCNGENQLLCGPDEIATTNTNTTVQDQDVVHSSALNPIHGQTDISDEMRSKAPCNGKTSTKNGSYLEKTGKVKVAVRLSLHDDKSTEELNDGNLVAYIPSELMCRMKFGSHGNAEESNQNDCNEEIQLLCGPDEIATTIMNTSAQDQDVVHSSALIHNHGQTDISHEKRIEATPAPCDDQTSTNNVLSTGMSADNFDAHNKYKRADTTKNDEIDEITENESPLSPKETPVVDAIDSIDHLTANMEENNSSEIESTRSDDVNQDLLTEKSIEVEALKIELDRSDGSSNKGCDHSGILYANNHPLVKETEIEKHVSLGLQDDDEKEVADKLKGEKRKSGEHEEEKQVDETSSESLVNSFDSAVKQQNRRMELQFFPLTQQASEFDYYSQASKDSNDCGASVQKLSEYENNRSKNKYEPTLILSPNRKPFSTAKTICNKALQENTTTEQEHLVESKDQHTSDKATEYPNLIAPRESEITEEKHIPPGTMPCPMFQTAGKKQAIQISAEGLSKANTLFSNAEVDNVIVPQSDSAPSVADLFLTSSHQVANNCFERKSSCKTSIEPFPMFQTAGKKRAIHVSDESLSKSNNLFSGIELESDCRKKDLLRIDSLGAASYRHDKSETNSATFPMFQTAGKQQTIQIAAESLSKASELFSRDSSNFGTRSFSDKLFDSTANSCRSIQQQSVEMNTHDRKFPTFQTAGKQHSIHVSKESIAKATCLFSDVDVSRVTHFEPSYEDAKDCDSSNKPLLLSNGKIENLVDSLPVFQTAGKKIAINVSDESMSKANQLFEFAKNTVNQSQVSDIPSALPKFQTAKDTYIGSHQATHITGSSHLSIHPAPPVFQSAGHFNFEDSERKDSAIKAAGSKSSDTSMTIDLSATRGSTHAPHADHLYQPRSDSLIAPMFRTAGKKTAISISEESLSKTSKLFQDVSFAMHPASSTDDCAHRVNNQSVASDIAGFTKLSNSSDQPVFQTAGTKAPIQISEESLSKANKLFDHNKANVGSASVFLEKCSQDTKAISLAPGIAHSAKSCEPAALPVFQTAGKMATIQISEKSLSKASKLFTAAEFKNEQDKNNHTMLPPYLAVSGKRKQTSSEPASSRSCSITDGFDHVQDQQSNQDLGTNFDTEATPAGDQSILKQSASRPRNRNRVRFSLDPTDVCNSRHQAEILKKNDVCLANGEKDIAACSLKTDDLGSFVTPDKRKLQLMNGGEVENCECPPTLPLTDDQSTNIKSASKNATKSDEEPPLSAYSYLPDPNNVYTPLHLNGDSLHLQSEIKSKRLFQVDESARIKRGSSAVNGHNFNKISLSQLSLSKARKTRSLENGVSDVTLRITSTNANKLRFGSENGLPLFIVGQREVPKGSSIGKVADIKKWLIEQGCDESLFTEKWIQNHFRFIVWKLAAMERSFSEKLAGQYLIYDHVLRQMKNRYEKELCRTLRPAVRMILNRDVSACMPLILCVSQILRFRIKTDKPGISEEEVRLELSDGWYALPATVDNVLLQFIEEGKIKVGTKLFVCNGQLLGSEDGVEPLDDSYSSSRRDCPLCLSINVNSTRLARWDAKLGFVSPGNQLLTQGSLLVKSLRDVFIDGGAIPAMDLIINKRYPKMFLEEINGTTLHLTETEDAARQIEHNTRHQRESEKIADIARTECIKEIDGDAPQQWKDMQRSNNPGEHYDKLDSVDKKLVDEWTTKRATLLQSMISKTIQDSMNDDPSKERKSKSYVKLLVSTFSTKKNRKSASLLAELTIWRVSDQQLDLVQEGSIVRMKDLVVKPKSKRGMLQLSANQETPMESLPGHPSHEQLIEAGYSSRIPMSLIHINIMAKQLIGGKNSMSVEHEFDVVACVIKVSRIGENTTVLYLTDESGLLIKVKRDHKTDNSDVFVLGNTPLPAVVAYKNLRLSSFDEDEHCAVATWELLSCKGNHCMQRICDDLHSWCTSDSGVNCCRVVLDKINAGIPFGTDHFIKSKVCFGYILCVDGANSHDVPTSAGVDIIIDYGGSSIKACLPMHLLQQAIELHQDTCTKICPGLSGLSLLNYLIRYNQMLLRFVLKETSSYSGESTVVLKVIGLSPAKINELARLHL